MKLLARIFPFFLICVFSLPLIVPFFHKGYFPTHDGLWAVVRLGDMYREIKDHQFPPRWSGVLNFGYGYPLFNFAYPFPYYLGVIIHLFRFSFIATTKLLFALSVPLSGLGMYLVSRKLWNSSLAGFLSSILYMYLPYRLVDLYVRGSLGESTALVLAPFLLWTLIVVSTKKSSIFTAMGAFFLGALIMSHNIMGLFFTPIVFFFAIVFSWNNKKNYINIFWIFLLGLGLSTFFWLPALVEKQWIYLSKIPIADRSINFVSLSQLFISPWQYGVPGSKDSFTFQVGWVQTITFLISFILLITKLVRKQTTPLFIWVLLATLLGMVGMLFSLTQSIWLHVPLLKEINYPWTLLAPIGFVISLFAGYISALKQKILLLVTAVLVLIALVTIFPFAKPHEYIYQPDSYFLTNDANTTSSSEYTPLWVKQFPLQRPDNKVVVAKGSIVNQVFASNKLSFQITIPKQSQTTINTIYYPGWEVFIDGKNTPISYNNTFGVMQIAVSSGNHIVTGKFTETPLRLFADIFSLFSLAIIIIVFCFSFIKKGQ